jgi:hypothetical protein
MTQDRAEAAELLAPYVGRRRDDHCRSRPSALRRFWSPGDGGRDGERQRDVDLAAESGGNVEGARPGEEVWIDCDGGAVRLLGMKDAPSTMPVDASRLYARNVANLLLLMTKDGAVVPDFDDEVVAGTCLTHDGVVRHEPTAALLEDGDR